MDFKTFINHLSYDTVFILKFENRNIDKAVREYTFDKEVTNIRVQNAKGENDLLLTLSTNSIFGFS